MMRERSFECGRCRDCKNHEEEEEEEKYVKVGCDETEIIEELVTWETYVGIMTALKKLCQEYVQNGESLRNCRVHFMAKCCPAD